MNDSRKPNILLRLWLGFWRGLTAFRMAVFNILFLLILALIIGFIFSPDDQLIIEDETTLVLAPRGDIVEEYTGTPVERMLNEALGQEKPETRLRDIVTALENAAEDDRINRVLVQTDQVWGMGIGIMADLSEAFETFRESGKELIAHGGYMGQGQYFLASQADEIWLDHDGMVMLEGFARYRNYYREGLDKLDVQVNVFREGTYKSAMEPWERSDMSDADREASEFWLGGLWQDYVETVAMHRGLPADVVLDIVNNLPDHLEQAGGNPAKMALDTGLVDRLISRPELRAELARRGAPDQDGGFRQLGFMDFNGAERGISIGDDRVGVIVAEGMIVEGEQPPGTIGAESTSKLIRQAARDDSIKAVVLRINSGGGSAFASEVIRRELMALKEAGKPVVVSMGDVAASGGYWIAMGADEVWASSTTITGSIGVIGFIPTFEETLAKVGIHTDGVGTAPLAGAMRLDRSLGEEVRGLVSSMIGSTYDEFVGLVAEHRDMDVADVRAVAEGRVWTGAQARERGLVDHLGGLSEAVASAARIAGLGEEFRVDYVEAELQPWQAFLTGMGARAVVAAGFNPSSSMLDWLPRETRGNILTDLRLVTENTRAGRPGVVAHCLCEPPM